MKTTFRRIWIPAALVLLCALLLVGVVFQHQARTYMQERTYSALEATTDTVARLASAYYAEDALDAEQFYLSLTAASRASRSQTVICDAKGKLVLCSESPLGCVHQGMVIGADYMQRVYGAQNLRSAGRIEPLYADARYVVGSPIYDKLGNKVGIVIASVPMEPTLSVFRDIMNTNLIVSLIAVSVAIALMAFFARRQTAPLRDMAKVANAFGHGQLSARVRVDRHTAREVQALALAFNNMADSLEKVESQWRDFVANVSHELKTPMTTISGFMDGMLDGTIPQEKQAQYMRLVSDETKRLNRLVRSMLDISRLPEEGGVPEAQKTQFDVGECAGRVLVTFEQRITAKGLDVQVDFPEHPMYTMANQDSITQVIYNLVDNAVKFCPQAGRLGLRIREAAGKIYVSISNSGQTIPPEELPLVFERFHKTDKSRTEKDGWGLGLYIVKTIVCSHGEDIRVSSAGDTTEFTFTLPIA